MTVEQQESLEMELADAQAIADPERRREAIEIVQCHMLHALVDCQRKTADRVKDLDAERAARRNAWRGARLLWTILRYIAAAGGGVFISKFLCA